jgi:hypothetical protein
MNTTGMDRPHKFPDQLVSVHIDDNLLSQYSTGVLEEPALGQIEEHLLVCEQCCARLTVFDDAWGLNG